MIWGYLIGYGYLAVLLVTAEFLVRRGVPQEVLRKVLHWLIGFEWLVLYFFFADSAQIVVIPCSFVVINALSYKFKFFRSIERKKDNHAGTIFYALAMAGMSIATACDGRFLVPFGVATFCLSFGDGAAALAGKYLQPNLPAFGKSLNGTLFCFVFAYVGQVVLFAILGLQMAWGNFAVLAAVCALAELLAGHGMDNIVVCGWCCATAYALYYCPALVGPVLMCFGGYVLAFCTHYAHLFGPTAAVLSGVMLATVGLWTGWLGYGCILGCYALTAIVERLCRMGHHGTRNTAQVLQNGLAAWVVALVYRLWPHPALLYAFVIAVAQAMCDSVASALGAGSRKDPVDIVRLCRVPKGTSGAVSAKGTLGALALGLLPALATYFVAGWRWAMLLVWLAPWLGMLLDSVLGATVQNKNVCPICGAQSECTAHCSRPTAHASGIQWMTNGRVNLVCNVLTTVVGGLAILFLF